VHSAEPPRTKAPLFQLVSNGRRPGQQSIAGRRGDGTHQQGARLEPLARPHRLAAGVLPIPPRVGRACLPRSP
jgi:hypothetical protein